jgi:alkanesulfonate monooxygenase
MPLRFHWRLPLAGEEPGAAPPPPGIRASAIPDLTRHIEFCRLAEASGIDSLLMACGFYMPDPIPLTAALGTAASTIRFLLAYRPGLLSPTVFVQQVNTLAALLGGRISLNVVIGHSQEEQRAYGDFLSHDERYRRADDFLAICQAFWRRESSVNFESEYYRIQGGTLGTPFLAPDRTSPEIYLGGSSPLALEVAARHAGCWLRMADAPEVLRPEVEKLRALGLEVGVRASLVVRPTREDAIRAALELVGSGDQDWVRRVFVQGSDSVSMRSILKQSGAAGADGSAGWLTPYLWNGLVHSRGVSAIALVGTPDDIAEAILEYRAIGITQFIFSGWPNTETLRTFGSEVLPLVRARAREAA